LAVREIAQAFGTFSIATGYPRAHAAQLPDNLKHLASWGASLLGHGALPTISMDNAAGHIDLVRDVEIALFCIGVLAALGALVVGLIRGPATSPVDTVGWRLDDLLLFGVIGDCVLFVAITPNDNGNYARYLTASILYGVILAARMTGRLLDRVPTTPRTLGTLALAGLLALCGIAYARDLRVPGAKQTDVALASFLEAAHLHDGLGDYWSSSITTVESNGRVRVRPVIPDKTHRLVRYGRQSSADWYRGVNFTFLVFNLARPWRDVDAATAAATFGSPSATYAVGTYRVLVWNTPVHVSTVGYSRK
jgi:hypothetical protein